MQTKILNIEQVVEDTELYPRTHENWFLTNKYAKAMESGAKFPPITVAFFANQYYLVDGKHRIEALKTRKQEQVQAEIIKVTSRAQIFAEAVKRNVIHGAALSTQETASAISKLRSMKFTDIQISSFVNIPLDRIENFVSSRIVNTITGEELSLKAPLQGFAGTVVSDEFVDSQRVYSAKSQDHVIDQLIALFETRAINLKNETTLNKLKILRKLIEQAVLSRRKK